MHEKEEGGEGRRRKREEGSRRRRKEEKREEKEEGGRTGAIRTSHGCLEHCSAVMRSVGSFTRSLEMKSFPVIVMQRRDQ